MWAAGKECAAARRLLDSPHFHEQLGTRILEPEPHAFDVSCLRGICRPEKKWVQYLDSHAHAATKGNLDIKCATISLSTTRCPDLRTLELVPPRGTLRDL
jgi:hypothetical protein